MGELAAQNLSSRGVGALVVANRSEERGAQLAARMGVRWVGLDSLEEELAAADIVISSTGSEGFVLQAETSRGLSACAATARCSSSTSPCPVNSTPGSTSLPGCYLYDVDDLERVVQESIAGRQDEAARAEARPREAADAFRVWRLSRDVVPAITCSPSARGAHPRDRARPGPGPARRAQRERASGRRVAHDPDRQQAVHVPTVRLKEAAARRTAPPGSRRFASSSTSVTPSADEAPVAGALMLLQAGLARQPPGPPAGGAGRRALRAAQPGVGRSRSSRSRRRETVIARGRSGRSASAASSSRSSRKRCSQDAWTLPSTRRRT